MFPQNTVFATPAYPPAGLWVCPSARSFGAEYSTLMVLPRSSKPFEAESALAALALFEYSTKAIPLDWPSLVINLHFVKSPN